MNEFELDSIFESAMGIVRLVKEHAELKEENIRLRKQLKEHEDRIQKMYNQNTAWAGDMIVKLVQNAEAGESE